MTGTDVAEAMKQVLGIRDEKARVKVTLAAGGGTPRMTCDGTRMTTALFSTTSSTLKIKLKLTLYM